MTYKCREFYCTQKKNAEPCAPPVFVRGNCRSQGFGNSCDYWAGPFLLLDDEDNNTWLLQDVTEKKKDKLVS